MRAGLVSEYLCLDQLLLALKIWCWKPTLFWLPCVTLKRRRDPSSLPACHSGRKGTGGAQGRVREADCLKRMKNWSLKFSSQVRFKLERQRCAHCRVLVSIVWILQPLFIGKVWTRQEHLHILHSSKAWCSREHSVLASVFLYPHGVLLQWEGKGSYLLRIYSKAVRLFINGK